MSELTRREVIQLAALAAAAPVMPSWANAEFRGEISLSDAIKVVRPWILKEPRRYDDVYSPKHGPLQIFRTMASHTATTVAPLGALSQKKLLADVMRDHIDTIAAYIIMSAEFNGEVWPEGWDAAQGPMPIRALRGFRSRFGRMPLPGDEGRLLVLGNRYLKVIKHEPGAFDGFDCSERYEVLTECTFFMERLT